MSSEKKRIPEQAPLLAWLVSCTVLAIWNFSRGLYLWAGYNLGGAVMALMVISFMWNGRMRMPALPLWIAYTTTMLHFLGGSLGAADRGSGPFCFEGMQPGEWLCADGVNGMYHVHAWWDELVHGTNSAATAIGWSLAWRRVSNHNGWEISPRMVAGICFSLTVAIGVGYEVYEFFGKTVFLTIDQGGYLNTASDLVSNLMGASVGTLFALFYDPLNAGVPSVSATPLPWQASLTLIATLPLVVVGCLLSLDLMLLGGALVDADYDRVGNVMLASMLLSLLLSAARLAQRSLMKERDA
jgi:hypothetical protein